MPVNKSFDQPLDRSADSVSFLGKDPVVWQIVRQVDAVYFSRALLVGTIDLDLSIDPAGTQNCGIDQIGAIRSQNNHDIVEGIDSVHFRAEHRHQCRKNIRMPRRAAGAEDRLSFVDEQERHETFFSFFASGGKYLTHYSFRFAHPHIEDLGPFDVHEIFAHLGSAFFSELLRQIERSRLADECFAAARRPIKQKTLRRGVMEFCKEIRMQKRQFDRVLDRLQGSFLAANFFPRQLRHRVEIIFVRFRAREHFQSHAVIRVNPDFVA